MNLLSNFSVKTDFCKWPAFGNRSWSHIVLGLLQLCLRHSQNGAALLCITEKIPQKRV
jgi:hypothetical protein